MAERRKTKRKYLMFYTRVFDVENSKLLGHLVDITPAGVMVISEQTLPAGQPFRLRIELSPEVAAEPFLEFDARSVWCHQDVNPQFYNTGFELSGITPESVAVIERIIEAYGFRDN
jgi:hypothetical protein